MGRSCPITGSNGSNSQQLIDAAAAEAKCFVERNGEALCLHNAYRSLTVDIAAKAGIGFFAGMLTAFAVRPVIGYRRILPIFASGVGTGFGLRDANYYLQCPTPDRIPRSCDKLASATNAFSSYMHAACARLRGMYKQ